MKHLFIPLLFVSIVIFSCSKNDRITFTDLARLSVDSTEIQNFVADGNSTLRIRLLFNEEANLKDISAKASLVNAKFENKSETEIALTPEVRQSGRIGAEFTVVSTTNPDSTFILIDINKYFLNFKLKPRISEPNSVKIEKSSSSVLNNFKGEVTLEGILMNSDGAKVSQGVKVSFVDLLDNGNSAGGRFRAESISSNSESKVSTIYSPGEIEPNQFVTISLMVLDSDGQSTGIETSTEIFVFEE